MKTFLNSTMSPISRFFKIGMLSFVLVDLVVASVQAGLHMNLQLYAADYGYFCFPSMSTNGTPASAPGTAYFAWSPSSTINSGIHYQLNPDNTTSGSGSANFPDYASFISEITNGDWTLLVTNSTATNWYHFTVSVSSGLSSNLFAPVNITFPTNGAINISNAPLFTWTGPVGWLGSLYVEADSVDGSGNYTYQSSDTLAADQTSWACPVMLPDGTNDLYVRYGSNITDRVIVSTPMDSNSVALSDFTWESSLNSSSSRDFSVGTAVSSSAGHTLKAYYSFSDGNIFALDQSGGGNSVSTIGSFGGGTTYITNDSVSDDYAAYFDNNSDLGGGNLELPTNLLATLAGSFSVSLWLKTDQVSGNDTDDGVHGNAGIVGAFDDSGANWVVPMSITGSKLAFVTGGDSQDVLHSTADINTGSYVHLVVTRDQGTGEKRIYVNGVLDNSDYGATNLLDTPTGGNIGADNGAGLQGTLDDIQFYAGVLSADEVQQLYDNPGTTIPDTSGTGVLAHYDFDEGTELAKDVSGNGHDLIAEGAFNGSYPGTDSEAIAGSGSVYFDGGSYLTAPASLLTTLAGSFSVSVWVNTTQNTVTYQNFSDAAGIVAADVPGDAYDVIPIGMDEYGEVVFNTGNPDQGFDDEMYSYNYVNDGFWHHIVVTRDQNTGEKNIYIDGVLDDSSPDYGTTNLLNAPALLTLGALADASDSDPTSPNSTGDNGYEGFLDDVQIYARVLSSNEVDYLFNHPGSSIAEAAKLPVDAQFSLSIVRNQTAAGADVYYCFPGLDSVNVTEATQHTVESPNGWFTGSLNGGSSYTEYSLTDVLNECTNGLWKLYINKGDASEQVFTFQVQIAGLDTNLLEPVLIMSPVNGATNVAVNPAYSWSGPVGFSGIFAQTHRGLSPNEYVSTNMPGDATVWPFPPVLHPGTNLFYLSYHTNDVPFITTTTPVDSSSTPINSWSVTGYVNSDATAQFLVTSQAFTLHVTLGTPSTVLVVGGKYAPANATNIVDVGGAANGTVTTDGTNLTYTATNGTADSFSYTLNDTESGNTTYTVAVVINSSGTTFNQIETPVDNGNGTMTIVYQGIPNYHYALETTGSLSPPVTWTPVVTNTAAADGRLSFSFDTSQAQGYFRTRYVP